MLEDAALRSLTQDAASTAALPAPRHAVARIDDAGESAASERAAAAGAGAGADDLAYVIYTSGSTGRPRAWRSRTAAS